MRPSASRVARRYATLQVARELIASTSAAPYLEYSGPREKVWAVMESGEALGRVILDRKSSVYTVEAYLGGDEDRRSLLGRTTAQDEREGLKRALTFFASGKKAGTDSVRREMTAEVLAAFGDALVGDPRVRTASLTSRLKQLWDMFQSAPSKWEEFKRLLRVKATSWIGVARELPGKIRSMVAEGKKWLEKAGDTLIQKVPLLRLYFDVGLKFPSVGDWMDRALTKMPEPIQRAVSAIATRARSLAEWIDSLTKKHPVLRAAGAVTSAAVFAVIWLNVTELSWDIPEILRGFLGGYSFVELLRSLPESGVGLIISLLFPGIPGGLVWNAILPITLALRLAWLIQQGTIEWRPGKELAVNWKALGMEPPPDVTGQIRLQGTR